MRFTDKTLIEILETTRTPGGRKLSPAQWQALLNTVRNAEQSATLPYSKIVSIGDVQLWLAELPIGRCGSADVRRIREAAVVLARGKPRKEDVRPLQSKWRVAQKIKSRRDPEPPQPRARALRSGACVAERAEGGKIQL